MRRIDEKDDIDCNADDQKTAVLLERTVMDVKCRLKVGAKLAGPGWTEVYGQNIEDIAKFECQTSLSGLNLDFKSESKEAFEVEGSESPVKASLRLMNIGSYF